MILLNLLENIITLNLLKSREFIFFAEKVLDIKLNSFKNFKDEDIKINASSEIEKVEKIEKTTFELFLVEKIIEQPIKIKAIKLIRDIVGIELRAAKELLDKAPVSIKKDLTKTEAETLLKKCETVEAKFEIR